jgi:hypothetical protein
MSVQCNVLYFIYKEKVPAFPNTKCASIERLILEEQTTPKDSFDFSRYASGGGTPGGVEGRESCGGIVLNVCTVRTCACRVRTCTTREIIIVVIV